MQLRANRRLITSANLNKTESTKKNYTQPASGTAVFSCASMPPRRTSKVKNDKQQTDLYRRSWFQHHAFRKMAAATSSQYDDPRNGRAVETPEKLAAEISDLSEDAWADLLCGPCPPAIFPPTIP